MGVGVVIEWMQALIDLPAADFDDGAQFWIQVTGTSPHQPDDHDEYVHLRPPQGDMHLELQRIDTGPVGVHLDLFVRDIAEATARATGLGAVVVAQPGHAVMRSPGGVVFCFVPFGGEHQRAPMVGADTEAPYSVDQICIDVPYEHFDDDVRFWGELTGWTVNPAQLPEFRSFDQPPELPLRLLVQRLGQDDPGPARSHLDIAAGEHITEVVERHVAAGAAVTQRLEHWVALRDPVGLPYCVTTRTPR